MRHLTCEPDIEVVGVGVLSMIENLRSEYVRPLMEKHGLTNVNPENWYPAQKYLDVLNDIYKNPNASTNFIAVGMKIAENVVLPPDMQNPTLPQILAMWDPVYKLQHRGDNIGGIEVQQLSETSYRTIHRNIYPDDLAYGVAYGWCKRFLPRGRSFNVRYEDIDNRKDKGGAEETVILIDW